MKKKIYAVVDLETTGGNPVRDRITEVAIALFDGERIIDQFQSLINPERTIPEHITRITGITNQMIENAPKFYEVAKTVVEMTKGAIFVAHNVRFDYSFLREEFKKLGFAYTRRQLCTVKLSRKVFPGLPSYSLGKLIKHFDINVSRRHRALDDTLATVELLQKILAKEAAEHSLDDIVNLGIKETLLPDGITLDFLHSLPEECGVYYFYDQFGKVVYVGKSLNIKKRVMEHFAKTTRKSTKIHQYVRSISYEITGSELIALLLESDEIKRLRPFINRAQRIRNFPYVIHAYQDEKGYICLEPLKASKKKRRELQVVSEHPKLGSAKGYLNRAIEQFELCRRLCGLESKIGNCIYHQINLCKGGCMGQEPVDEYNERAQLAINALNIGFEEDFIIVDKGRTPEEKSVVLVMNNQYKGFGFLDQEHSIQSPEDIFPSIKNFESNPEIIRIIRYFMSKNKEFEYVKI